MEEKKKVNLRGGMLNIHVRRKRKNKIYVYSTNEVEEQEKAEYVEKRDEVIKKDGRDNVKREALSNKDNEKKLQRCRRK